MYDLEPAVALDDTPRNNPTRNIIKLSLFEFHNKSTLVSQSFNHITSSDIILTNPYLLFITTKILPY